MDLAQANRRPTAAESFAKSPLVLRYLAGTGAARVAEVKIPHATGLLRALQRFRRPACTEGVNQPRKLCEGGKLEQSEPAA